MYLERVKSKGRYYLYLKEYAVREYNLTPKVTLFAFGRLEKALKEMYYWRDNFKYFPKELKRVGCTKKDLLNWICKLEKDIDGRFEKIV